MSWFCSACSTGHEFYAFHIIFIIKLCTGPLALFQHSCFQIKNKKTKNCSEKCKCSFTDELQKKCLCSFVIVVADGKHYVLSAKLALIQEKSEEFFYGFFFRCLNFECKQSILNKLIIYKATLSSLSIFGYFCSIPKRPGRVSSEWAFHNMVIMQSIDQQQLGLKCVLCVNCYLCFSLL